MKSIYAMRRSDDVSRDLRTLQRRLRDRMAAGRMAIGLLKDAVGHRVNEVAAGWSRVSVNQMARLVIDDTGQSNPGNVKTRIWRPGLPAIHIASAFQCSYVPTTRRAGRGPSGRDFAVGEGAVASGRTVAAARTAGGRASHHG